MALGDAGVSTATCKDANDDISTGHTLTGPTKALYLCFGFHDLYWLQLVHRLPESVIKEIAGVSRLSGGAL